MIKKFIYALLRFSIVPLAVLLFLETGIAVRKKELLTEYRLEKVFRNSGNANQWVAQVNHPRKVLLLGSSSVKYGLSCSLLNKLSNDSLAFINLAADARDPVETYFILKQIDLTHVKTVFMGIDPWIFTKNYYRNRNPYLYLDLGILSAARYSLEHDPKLFPNRYKCLIGSQLSSPAVAGKTNQPIPADFGSASLTKKPVNFNDPVFKKFELGKYGWSGLQFEYLQKIVRLCESRHITFTAFYPPKRSDFIADYNTYCKEIHTSFLEKLKEAGFTSPITCSFSSMQPGGDSLFADAYHLNRKGQEIYTKIFFRLIND